MFGLFVGTLCLIALVASVRRRRYAHYGWFDGQLFGEERPFGPRFYRHQHRQRGFGAGGGRGLLFGLFRRLDATPGQEKAIMELLSQLRSQAQELRTDLRGAHKDVAAALAGESLDAGALDGAFLRQTEAVVATSEELKRALVTLHEILDDEQRRLIAELIADGSLLEISRRMRAYTC